MTTPNNARLHRLNDDDLVLAVRSAAEPLIDVLGQLYAVVETLTDLQYTAKPVGPFDSSIGSHVRHCLDHVASVLAVATGDEVDYDRRERGTDVESSPRAALNRIAELQRRLIELPPQAMHRSTWVSVMLTVDGDAVRLHSSVGREIAFVLSHTIHHHAIIGAMVRMQDGRLPDRFGYAPSTVAHASRVQQQQQQWQEADSCARSA